MSLYSTNSKSSATKPETVATKLEVKIDPSLPVPIIIFSIYIAIVSIFINHEQLFQGINNFQYIYNNTGEVLASVFGICSGVLFVVYIFKRSNWILYFLIFLAIMRIVAVLTVTEVSRYGDDGYLDWNYYFYSFSPPAVIPTFWQNTSTMFRVLLGVDALVVACFCFYLLRRRGS